MNALYSGVGCGPDAAVVGNLSSVIPAACAADKGKSAAGCLTRDPRDPAATPLPDAARSGKHDSIPPALEADPTRR